MSGIVYSYAMRWFLTDYSGNPRPPRLPRRRSPFQHLELPRAPLSAAFPSNSRNGGLGDSTAAMIAAAARTGSPGCLPRSSEYSRFSPGLRVIGDARFALGRRASRPSVRNPLGSRS